MRRLDRDERAAFDALEAAAAYGEATPMKVVIAFMETPVDGLVAPPGEEFEKPADIFNYFIKRSADLTLSGRQFADFYGAVDSIPGIDAADVIAPEEEAKYDESTGGRWALVARVHSNVLKRLVGSCAMSGESFASLSASGLQSVEFDHDLARGPKLCGPVVALRTFTRLDKPAKGGFMGAYAELLKTEPTLRRHHAISGPSRRGKKRKRDDA